MRKAFALAMILVLAISGIANAGNKPITGTIELVPGQTPQYQKTVWFNWSVSGQLKGYQYPMIYVRCEQKDNPEAYDNQGGVYGMLERPYASPFEAYKLGGGSSVWVESGGGPAHCIAHIMIYPGLHSGPILDLNTVEFEALG